jgi:hypothetical protein
MKKLLFLLFAAFSLCAAEKVVPGQRYRADLEIRAKAKCYPLDWFCINVPVKYPNAELVFLNENNKPVRHFRPYRYHAFSAKFVPASFEFYPPEGTAAVRLRSNGAEVRNFRVTPAGPGKNLAVPLDYRVSGQFIHVEITPGKDGSAVYDATAGNIYFYPVPVEPGAKYRLTVNGHKGDKPTGLVIRLTFYANGNSSKSRVSGSKEPMRIGGNHSTFTTTFLVPEKARWFQLFCMWGLVYDYQLEKIQ